MKPAEEPRIIRGMRMWRYASSETHCSACQWRDDCLSSKTKCREIWRNEHQDLIEQHRQRMDANTKIMRLRAGLVEHPFGTLKQRAGWSHFLVRGKPKVLGEWSLMVMAYNFTRVLNILGIKNFKEICTQLHKEGHLMPA